MDQTEWPPVKSQNVRLTEIFLLGPSMIFAGAAATLAGRNSLLLGAAGLVTFVGGFATIAMNAINYGKVAQRQAALQQSQPQAGLGSGYWRADPLWGQSNAAWQRYMSTGYYTQ